MEQVSVKKSAPMLEREREAEEILRRE